MPTFEYKFTKESSGIYSDDIKPFDMWRDTGTGYPEPGDRGVFGGGHTGSAAVNVIDYITISTAGDATDFGDLTVARGRLGATSNGLL